jgi:hypothetical protein
VALSVSSEEQYQLRLGVLDNPTMTFCWNLRFRHELRVTIGVALLPNLFAERVAGRDVGGAVATVPAVQLEKRRAHLFDLKPERRIPVDAVVRVQIGLNAFLRDDRSRKQNPPVIEGLTPAWLL